MVVVIPRPRSKRLEEMDRWYLDNLVCPRDRNQLEAVSYKLACPEGHAYPVVDGVPVMLLDDQAQTIAAAEKSLEQAAGLSTESQMPELYLDSLSLSEVRKKGIIHMARNGACKVDPVVAHMIIATNGNLYTHLLGKLESYPIPHLRLPPGDGQTFSTWAATGAGGRLQPLRRDITSSA